MFLLRPHVRLRVLMPVYLYRCGACLANGEKWQSIKEDRLVVCPECHEPELRRVYSFSLATVMHEHFDHTVGKVISDRRQFVSELKRKSEEATERTGIPHNYVPVDLSDRESLNVTEEGMDSTLRRTTNEGKREVKKWL